MRKILIATPLRGDVPPEYVRLLTNVLMQRSPDIKFGYGFVGGTSVQWARDEAVKMARDKNCTEIVFWDKDLEPSTENFFNLINREEEFVCSLYAKRELETHWHITSIKGEEPDKNGLLKVFQAAIGFSKIKMSVFDKIRSANPERAYQIKNAGADTVNLFEYFPMERFGPNTASGKLKRIKNGEPVDKVMADADYSTNAMLGEDYSFCRMAREAGVSIYVDTNIIVPHMGECLFPIPTQQLKDMLKEEWRADES